MIPIEEAHAPGEWPADARSIAAARHMLTHVAGTVVVACDSDVDGLAGGVILEKVIAAAGAQPVVMPVRRGEHVHSDSTRLRIREQRPRTPVVADMGSRPAPIIPELPTLVIDHHNASAGGPPGAVFVNGYDRPPVATSSVLAYAVCRPLAGTAPPFSPSSAAECANGHARATGGSLPTAEFETFLEAVASAPAAGRTDSGRRSPLETTPATGKRRPHARS